MEVFCHIKLLSADCIMQEKALVLDAAEDEHLVVSTIIGRRELGSTQAEGWIYLVTLKVKNSSVKKDFKTKHH